VLEVRTEKLNYS